jgi:hypothetical protein
MRIWSEPYDSLRHRNPMALEPDEPEGIVRHWRARTLEPHQVTFVHVAGFTFEFHSAEQLRACLAFYAQRHHPSRRSAAAAELVRSGEVTWRLEVERWHERLPLYLREEPKRLKVCAALKEALRRMDAAATS